MIALEKVNYRPGGMSVLTDISLVVPQHALFVIMGASGAGKSTVLRLMNGLIQPASGRILVNGQDIAGMTERQLLLVRQKLGMVFQSAALFDSLTVAENVGFAWRRQRMLPRQFEQRVEQTLALVGLDGVGQRKPAELSGGMRKRVGIARAIAMEPEVLLYDEPTSGLDPVTSHTIWQLIKDMQTRLQVTSVVVTHDVPGGLAAADEVALLHQGRIAFAGAAEAVQRSSDPLVQEFVQGGVGAPV